MARRTASSDTERRVELRHDEPDDLPGVLGNPVRLRQMISNLVGNAIKYTPAGGKIWVRGRTEADQVILEVADNGPGIPASDQPYIFDKFFRASNTPESTPGTGLGLAIVKSIVENHQGRIWFESGPGQGTVFTVVLPLRSSDAPGPGPTMPSARCSKGWSPASPSPATPTAPPISTV